MIGLDLLSHVVGNESEDLTSTDQKGGFIPQKGKWRIALQLP
jgi:hypothetical protein